HLATAAGKDGRMWILNRDDMGGFQTTDVPPFINIGRCFCGQSYYNNRVVTSGGVNNSSGQSITRVSTYRINTNLVTPLTLEASSAYMVPTKQQPGTFTSVSSNGNSNPIIWTVARPTGTDNHLTLYAFNGTASSGTLATLWSGTAGFWNDMTQTAFTVATVANGYVYVGSYKMLDIFGLKQKKT
ncbi:MAG TPA: hypothetical protein VJ728_14475, partial [Candidatus Binataceae bacterium]|nr:hypothetical protein [Candidatus Binataceae bacterium]